MKRKHREPRRPCDRCGEGIRGDIFTYGHDTQYCLRCFKEIAPNKNPQRYILRRKR